MKNYQSHKIIQAAQIILVEPIKGDDENPDDRIALTLMCEEGQFIVPAEVVARYMPVMGDWVMVCPDGYVSISPAKAFEEGYTEVREPKDDDTLFGVPAGRVRADCIMFANSMASRPNIMPHEIVGAAQLYFKFIRGDEIEPAPASVPPAYPAGRPVPSGSIPTDAAVDVMQQLDALLIATRTMLGAANTAGAMEVLQKGRLTIGSFAETYLHG